MEIKKWERPNLNRGQKVTSFQKLISEWILEPSTLPGCIEHTRMYVHLRHAPKVEIGATDET